MNDSSWNPTKADLENREVEARRSVAVADARLMEARISLRHATLARMAYEAAHEDL